MQNTKRLVDLAPASMLGRILLSSIFILSGLAKIPGWDNTLGFMQSRGMHGVRFFLTAAIAMEILGGISILVGYRARAAALLLTLYLVPVTLIFHSFWMYSGMQAQMQLGNFLKNIAIIGGLLGLVGNGAGAWSLDARQETRLEEHTKLRRVA